jgi:hypothetical protein
MKPGLFDVLAVLGGALVVAGVAMIYRPAAVILGGLVLAGGALMGAQVEARKQKKRGTFE